MRGESLKSRPEAKGHFDDDVHAFGLGLCGNIGWKPTLNLNQLIDQ